MTVPVHQRTNGRGLTLQTKRNFIHGFNREIKVAMRPENLVNTAESKRRNYFPDNHVLAPFNSLIRAKMFPVIFDQLFLALAPNPCRTRVAAAQV